jgi:hypothetical protein
MMQETSGLFELMKWGWVALIGVIVWMWQKLTGHVEDNSEALRQHIIDDLKKHAEFVSTSCFHEFGMAVYARFDKLDEKQDKLLDQVVLGVGREEFKGELQAIYAKLDSIERRKVDKSTNYGE